jgi:glutathione S-transferase
MAAGNSVRKLFHCKNARSFRVLWTMEELGLPYELEMLKFPPRHREPGYLDINPLGTVPTFIDGDSTMTESAAICHYLVTRYGPSSLAVAPDEPAYADYLNFLVMAEATLTFPQTIYLRYSRLEPEERRVPQAAADYAQWFASRFKAAAALMGSDYACAGRFTAADISLGYAVLLANAIGLSEAVPERAQSYWNFLRQRPAVLRAEARQTNVPQSA